MSEYAKVFKSKNLWLAYSSVLMPFMFFTCGLYTYFNLDQFSWDIEGTLLIIFGIMSILMFWLLPTLPKEIIFENKIIVKRYIYQNLLIEYSEVVDFNSHNLVTQKGSISLNNMINGYELDQCIEQLVKEKKIKVTGKLRRKQERDITVSVYSGIPALLAYFLLSNIFSENISKNFLYLLTFAIWIFFYKLIDNAFSKAEDQ